MTEFKQLLERNLTPGLQKVAVGTKTSSHFAGIWRIWFEITMMLLIEEMSHITTGRGCRLGVAKPPTFRTLT